MPTGADRSPPDRLVGATPRDPDGEASPSVSDRRLRRLALELDLWQVTLLDGVEIRIWAHSYSVEGANYVFEMLVVEEGIDRLVKVAMLPVDIVASVIGG